MDVFLFILPQQQTVNRSLLICGVPSFTTEPEVILKNCTTRWLKLASIVGRCLDQLEGLKSYFLSSDEQTNKV